MSFENSRAGDCRATASPCPFVPLLRSLFPVLAITTLTALSPADAATTWTQEGFAEFRRGRELDAGSNLYVSAKGGIEMITRWDLNGDGFLDIVVPAGHAHTEKENTYLYLNTDGDIDGRTRIELPGGGSAAGLVADLNRDGLNDLVVANAADSHVGDVDTWIYWGTPGGFSPQSRTNLPAFRAKAVVAGDFNGDSWIDLAIACEWEPAASEASQPRKVSLIYWNSADGFHEERRLEIPLEGELARAIAASDLDGDGKSDLVAVTKARTHLLLSSRGSFASGSSAAMLDLPGAAVTTGDFNGDGMPDLAVGSPGKVIVMTSRGGSFDPEGATLLAISNPMCLAAADVDRDGLDDLIVANHSSTGGATWTDSLVIPSKGGSPDLAAATRLPTLGASWVSAGDLNGDGYPELVFSNENVTNERSMLSYIYWSDKGAYRFGSHSQLRTEGSIANAIGDVDNDGDADVVFFNNEGGFRDGASETYIYWGDGTRNFPMERRLVIPTHQVFGLGAADLDNDGRTDLILTRENYISGVTHEPSGVSVYWGGEHGFLPTTDITATSAYGGVRVADINKDGYLDILSGGGNTDPHNPEVHGIPIYWGSATGFRRENRTVIPSKNERIRGPLLADLDKDGWLDVVAQEKPGTITIWKGAEGYQDLKRKVIDLGRPDPLMYIQAADFNRDSWLDLLLPQRGPADGTEVTSLILYGGPDGFEHAPRAELPTYVAYQNSIADLDRDGWLDIVFCAYGGEVQGNRPSLVYWGGPDGFLTRPRTELPTYGSSGSVALDFDGDGWLDLFFVNHRRAGSITEARPHRHITESLLYWGGSEGFSPDRRWEVLGRGPSGLNLRDPGNAYDRGLHEDYISASFQIPEGERFSSIDWSAATPHGTSVRFQVRHAATAVGLEKAVWEGPDGPGSWWENPGRATSQGRGGVIQYRARLATPNGASSPSLTRVSLSFE